MNDIPNYGNLQENKQNKKINDAFLQQQTIKKAMNNLKLEIAQDLGYDKIRIPNGGNLTSHEIGVYAGPVGGVIVKDLIASAEEILLKKYKEK